MAQKSIHVNGGEETKKRKVLWSPEEDERLHRHINNHGVSTWNSVAEDAGLSRTGKSCRLRWMNYLRLDLNKEPITKREEQIIISMQKNLGNRWSDMAARMPGRTDNDIKNFWNSRIRKRQNAIAGATDIPAAVTNKEAISTAAPLVPIGLPELSAQPPDAIAAAGTQSTTAQEQSASSMSEVSAGNRGEDAQGYDLEYIIHLLSLDLDPADDLMDMPAVALDEWLKELSCPNWFEGIE